MLDLLIEHGIFAKITIDQVPSRFKTGQLVMVRTKGNDWSFLAIVRRASRHSVELAVYGPPSDLAGDDFEVSRVEPGELGDVLAGAFAPATAFHLIS